MDWSEARRAQKDPADGRRTLVWRSEAGMARLEAERDVLARELLARAMARMSPADVAALLRGTRALIAAAAARKGETP